MVLSECKLWLLGVGLFCGVYPEVAVIDWATVFAKDVLNVEVALRSILFAAFMVGMIIGRLSMTKLAEKFHPHTLASRGAFLAAGALAIAAMLSVPVASVSSQLGLLVTAIFWGLAGLGLAPVSPAFYSAAGHIPGVSTAWAISRLSLFNAVVSIAAKTMMGALSEGVGLSLAFFFPITLAIGAGLIAASFVKRARRSELDAATPATGPIAIIITEEGDR